MYPSSGVILETASHRHIWDLEWKVERSVMTHFWGGNYLAGKSKQGFSIFFLNVAFSESQKKIYSRSVSVIVLLCLPKISHSSQHSEARAGGRKELALGGTSS